MACCNNLPRKLFKTNNHEVGSEEALLDEYFIRLSKLVEFVSELLSIKKMNSSISNLIIVLEIKATLIIYLFYLLCKDFLLIRCRM